MASPSNLGVCEILRIVYCGARLPLFPFELRLPLVHIGGQTFLGVLAGEEQLLQFALDAQRFGKGNFRSGDNGAFDASDRARSLIGRAELPRIGHHVIPEGIAVVDVMDQAPLERFFETEGAARDHQLERSRPPKRTCSPRRARQSHGRCRPCAPEGCCGRVAPSSRRYRCWPVDHPSPEWRCRCPRGNEPVLFVPPLASLPWCSSVALRSHLNLAADALTGCPNALLRQAFAQSFCPRAIRRLPVTHSVQKNSGDGFSQDLSLRIHLGVMPFVDPIHHPKQAQHGDARIDARDLPLAAQIVEDAAGDFVVSPLDFENLLAIGVLEGVLFVGQHLHFNGVTQEILNVVADQDTKPLLGFSGRYQALLEALENARKGIRLNEIQEFLLAFEIVVQPGKGDTASAADVADGSAFKAFFREYPGGMPKNMLQLIAGRTRVDGGSVSHGVESNVRSIL